MSDDEIRSRQSPRKQRGKVTIHTIPRHNILASPNARPSKNYSERIFPNTPPPPPHHRRYSSATNDEKSATADFSGVPSTPLPAAAAVLSALPPVATVGVMLELVGVVPRPVGELPGIGSTKDAVFTPAPPEPPCLVDAGVARISPTAAHGVLIALPVPIVSEL